MSKGTVSRNLRIHGFMDDMRSQENETARASFNWKDYKVNPLQQRFIHVDGGLIWVEGAYWDYRVRDHRGPERQQQEELVENTIPYVRVLLVGPYANFKDTLLQAECEFYYDSESDSHHEKSQIIQVYVSYVDDRYPENWTRPYYAVCIPPRLDERIPLSMSLVFPGQHKQAWSKDFTGYMRYFIFPIRGQYDSSLHARLANGQITDISSEKISEKKILHSLDPILHPLRKLMMCVKPARNGVYHDYKGMIAFIAYYHALGVTHFTLYDTGSFNPRVYKVFNIAANMGISIEVKEWAMREVHGWENHQVLFNEVCMYDAMDRNYDNVAINDFDEFIAPRAAANMSISGAESNRATAPSLLDMIDHLDKQYPKASNYKFHMKCFKKSDRTHSLDNNMSLTVEQRAAVNIIPYLYTVMTHDGGFAKSRNNKHIYKPYRIGEVFIHSAIAANGDYHEVFPSDKDVVVHHYQYCNVDLPNLQIDDTIPIQYGEQIMKGDFMTEILRYFQFNNKTHLQAFS